VIVFRLSSGLVVRVRVRVRDPAFPVSVDRGGARLSYQPARSMTARVPRATPLVTVTHTEVRLDGQLVGTPGERMEE
jgi:hypothetical protein